MFTDQLPRPRRRSRPPAFWSTVRDGSRTVRRMLATDDQRFGCSANAAARRLPLVCALICLGACALGDQTFAAEISPGAPVPAAKTAPASSATTGPHWSILGE